MKNIENGVVGAGVKSFEPKDRLDGRRLPMEPWNFSPRSTLARVRTILGRLAHCGVMLRHIVGSESDRVEKKLYRDLLRFRGRDGERVALARFWGTLRRLLYWPLWGPRGRDTKLGNFHGW